MTENQTSANAVTVLTGSQELRVPAGLSIAQIREQLAKLGINDPSAVAYAGSTALSESDVPASGTTVRLVRKMGEKGNTTIVS